MKTKEIIGYNLTKPEYEKAAVSIITAAEGSFYKGKETFEELGDPQEGGFLFAKNSYCYEHLQKAGVLELWFNPVYKEYPELEVGKWYRIKNECTYWLMCYKGDSEGYGFNTGGYWSENYRMENINPWEPATDREVEEALTREAFKIGFREGAKFKTPKHGTKYKCESNKFYYSEHGLFSSHNLGGYLIFSNEIGKWAEIITEEKPTKEELLKQIEELKQKINLL